MRKIVFSLILGVAAVCATVPSHARVSDSEMVLIQNVGSAVRQAEARYNSGNVTGAADLARKILAKYPANTDAKAILDKCIATERKDYDDAVASESVASLNAFLKKYPESGFRDDVADRIEDLPLWLIAKGKNTIDSYKRYLADSEHLLFKSEADNAIADLTATQAYYNALRVNTIEALKQFRKDYPASSYDKRASNKIARLMADRFTSTSSYADKRMATEYATDDETIRYVNNKFAYATRNNEAYSSVYRPNSSQNTSSEMYSGNYKKTRGNAVSLGLNVMWDYGVSCESGDYHAGFPFSIGLGGLIRFGRPQNSLNLITGVKALMSYAKIQHGYLSENTTRVTAREVSIPLDLNWNFFKAEEGGMYLGIGYQYGLQTSEAMKIAFGTNYMRSDFSLYYIHYFKGMFKEAAGISPFLGMSYTYYF